MKHRSKAFGNLPLMFSSYFIKIPDLVFLILLSKVDRDEKTRLALSGDCWWWQCRYDWENKKFSWTSCCFKITNLILFYVSTSATRSTCLVQKLQKLFSTSKMARSKKCTRAHEKTTTNFLCTPATTASVVKPAVALTRVTSERVYATRVCVARTWIALVCIHTGNSVPGISGQTGARKVAVRVHAIWSVVSGTVVQSRITAFIWIE